MSSELVPFTETAVQEIFNWDKTVSETKNLVKEDSELTSTIEEAMVRRFEVRVKIGFNLMALQEEHSKIGYGDFTTVELPRLGIERTFAHRCIRVAKLYDNPLVARGQRAEIPDLPIKRWEQLASPSMHPTVIEQVLSGEIEPTQQAIKEANERAKQAEEKAKQIEEQARLALDRVNEAQMQLSVFEEQEQSNQSAITNLTQRIKDLEQEIVTIATPPVEIKEIPVVPPETTKRVQDLEAEVATLTRQKENLAKQNEELSADLDAQEADRERIERELRIRKAWQDSTDAIFKSIKLFQASLPLPIDMQIFDTDDWARLADVESALMNAFKQCASLRQDTTDRFIDASLECIEGDAWYRPGIDGTKQS